MTAKKHLLLSTFLLIIILCTNLPATQMVLAEGENPTEPPAATQIATEQPLDVQPESSPAAAPLLAEALTQLPENTEVAVLDASGEPLPLASQEAAEVVEVADPMWCPAGVLPGGQGCSSAYTGATAIADLINNMISNTSAYTQNGVIYFTATTGGSLNLTDAPAPTGLGTTAFNNLSSFNLTLQGGWNGVSGSGAAFSGQTNFANNTITIGSLTNPWAGSITLQDIKFGNVSSGNAVTVYTTSGNITLSNVDVLQQGGGTYTALLNSTSGNITVQQGSSFDGNSPSGTTDESRGFSATTGSGAITISDTVFKDSRKNNPGSYNGATLSAPVVTLNNVTAIQNDGNGIAISNANLVTLNNVLAAPDINGQGNGLSGILINGNGSTLVQVMGGSLADNKRYGIEVYGASLFLLTTPVCPRGDPTGNLLGCYNVTPTTDTTAPLITPVVTGLSGSNGWYRSNVTVTWSASDSESGIVSWSGCTTSQVSGDTSGATLTCSVTNGAGLSNSESITIKIDSTAPVLSLPADILTEIPSSNGGIVTYSASVLDNLDPAVQLSCSPESGSTFPVGMTQVKCSASDSAGNTASGWFQVTVQNPIVPTPSLPPATVTPAPTLTGTSAPTLSAPTKTPALHSSLILPVTGGELIDLDCHSVVWAFGVKLTFYNLCDHQTTLHRVGIQNLPAALPDGLRYVIGLKVNVLSQDQVLTNLPDNSGVEMDFPLNRQALSQFALLYWNDPEGDGTGEWVQIKQPLAQNKIPQALNTKATDEFYQITQTLSNAFYPGLTTDKTGIFILVKK